jgi:cytochrome c1
VELRLWLNDPQSLKPGCYMPRMRLTPTEVTDLTAYLEALK